MSSGNRALTQALIEELREQIDRIDRSLVEILNRRAEYVQRIGDLKRRSGIAIHDPKRESRILRKVEQANQGPLGTEQLQRMFKAFIREFRKFEGITRLPPKRSEKPLTVSIIGLGLLGGSLALAIRKYWPQHRLVGYDSRGQIQLQALRLVDKLCESPKEALSADIIVLAMPVVAIIEFLKANSKNFEKGSIVTDLGSTKRLICSAAERYLPKDVDFIGGHPVAGKAVSGARNAEADLFFRRTWILAPTRRSRRANVKRLSRLFSGLGAELTLTDPKTHDQALAVTSHLPQMISVALANTADRRVGRSRQRRSFFGPAFREMARLAESPYDIWRDIAKTNPDNLGSAIQELSKLLKSLSAAARSGKFEKQFQKAREFKKALDNRST